MQGEKMRQLAAVQLKRVPVMQDSFSRRETLPDPALALIRTPLGKGEERQMQLITVNRVAASMKSLMPSREKEIGNAEQNAYHGNGVVWPKAEFLAKLPTDLFFIAIKKFTAPEIVSESARLFSDFKASRPAA